MDEDDEQCGGRYSALWHAFFQSLLPALVPLILHSSLPVGEVLTDPAVHVSLDSTRVHLQFQALVKGFFQVYPKCEGMFLVLEGIFNLLGKVDNLVFSGSVLPESSLLGSGNLLLLYQVSLVLMSRSINLPTQLVRLIGL